MPSKSERWILLLIVTAFLAAALFHGQPKVERYGYSPDPDGARKFAAGLPTPTFAAAAPDAMEKAKPKDTFLWRAMDAAHKARYGTPFKCSNQLSVGSCVAHGAAHAVFCSQAVSWSVKERDEPPFLAHQGAIYGGSRVEARGMPGDGARPYGGYSDGSTGYHAAKWLREWGVIDKRQYPSIDCTISNVDIEREMGAFGCGGKGDANRLDNEAKKVPCLYVTQVKTWDELVAAITSGHAVTVASNQGFTKSLDSQSFAAPSGVWFHQMAIIGVRFDREGAAIINSWGSYLTYNHPRYPHDLPDGVFWADRKVIERMLSQGDSWAISAIKFKYRDINHNDWLGGK
jgi:hypothetical protein